MVELATISDIVLSDKYPFVRTIYFKDKKYRVVLASNLNFDIGEEVLYIPDGSILPPTLLKNIGLWDYEEHKGRLGGLKGDIVKPYRFNSDKAYFSYGMILPLDKVGIENHTGPLDLRENKELDKLLQIRKYEKGLPYYYKGALFMADIRLKKTPIPDLEDVYTEFIGESEVYVERLVPGRSFLVTMSRSIRDHNAIGKDHNIYISTNGLKKYVFFSGVSSAFRNNPFIRLFLSSRLPMLMDLHLKQRTSPDLITYEMVQAFEPIGHERLDHPDRNKMLLTDVFIGTEPFGRYMTRDEKKRHCNVANVKQPPELYEGPFDFDLIKGMAENEKYGVVVRSENNTKRAILYREQFRIDRLRESR